VATNTSQTGPDEATPDIATAKLRLGERVRAHRERLGITTQELADRASVTRAMVSQVERGQVAPSLSTLLNLASALGIDVGDLFGAPKTNGRVVRRNERRVVDYPGQEVRDEWLSADSTARLLVLRSIVGPGSGNGPQLLSHGSEVEFVFVLSGAITILIEGEEPVSLNQGDSLTFASSAPHGFANHGTEPAELIWVSTPGRY
jgi:transcriptional regulator with XRE-family HTH domain